MFDDNYFMRIALNQAQEAFLIGEVPVGAVIVVDSMIIAKAYNLTEKLKDVTAHAEIQAITSASNFLGGKFLNRCTMYVTLEPCMMCAGALYWSRIERVVFACSDSKRGFQAMGGKLHPKTKLTQGILQEEASELLEKFFALKR